jgi:phosphoribosylglycinamide formyltransferase-1
MTARKRIGVLISGRGSNMLALIDACSKPVYPADISIVISNRPDAHGLGVAAESGIPTLTIDHKNYPTREAFEADLNAALKQAKIDFICNAGFMRLLTKGFVDEWRNRQLNIHPSLLPSFKGLHTHERALEAGVKISGCTVHFVRTEMDTGPIIAQAAIPVLPDDSADDLAKRVQEAEHKLYPLALKLVASGEASVKGEHVTFKNRQTIHGPYIAPWFD